jgi:hypothetical protein
VAWPACRVRRVAAQLVVVALAERDEMAARLAEPLTLAAGAALVPDGRTCRSTMYLVAPAA